MDSFISSLLYPKLHPVRRHVHSSHLGGTLLLLHQLTDFNETFSIFSSHNVEVYLLFLFFKLIFGVSHKMILTLFTGASWGY
jgi:hypothetical protein